MRRSRDKRGEQVAFVVGHGPSPGQRHATGDLCELPRALRASLRSYEQNLGGRIKMDVEPLEEPSSCRCRSTIGARRLMSR